MCLSRKKLSYLIAISLFTYLNINITYAEQATIQQLTQSADLAFKGKVIDINYQTSKTNNGDKGIPYTFVTYAIEQLLNGNYTSSTIALRFAGGPTADGGFLLPSETVLFDKGEEDILFVSKNTTSICPLVDCTEGRIRIINNKLYDDEGNELLTDNKSNAVYKGNNNELPEVVNHKMGTLDIKLVASQEPVNNNSLKAATNSQASTNNLSSLSLDKLVQQIKSTPALANAASKLPSKTADISQPIIEKPETPVAPINPGVAAIAAGAASVLAPLEQLEKERQEFETQQNQPNFADKGLTPTF